MKKLISIGFLTCAMAAAWRLAVIAQQASTNGPKYTSSGELLRPGDYREWVYLTSGLGMTYGPALPPAARRPPNFDNVFVNRESHRQFMATGKWPDKTIFALEIRRAEQHVSIDNGGQTQGGLVRLEVAVKDQGRFPDTTWGYFDFGAMPDLAAATAALPKTAACYSCHRDNTAVEWTFVQFYPTLFEVAKRLGTVKSTYDPSHKP